MAAARHGSPGCETCPVEPLGLVDIADPQCDLGLEQVGRLGE